MKVLKALTLRMSRDQEDIMKNKNGLIEDIYKSQVKHGFAPRSSERRLELDLFSLAVSAKQNKLEFKNAKNELQQEIGVLVTKFYQVDQCIVIVEQVIVIKIDLDNEETD